MGEPFKKWVHGRVEARNLKVAEEGDMMIELDPDIAEIYRASNAVSGRLNWISRPISSYIFYVCLTLCLQYSNQGLQS